MKGTSSVQFMLNWSVSTIYTQSIMGMYYVDISNYKMTQSNSVLNMKTSEKMNYNLWASYIWANSASTIPWWHLRKVLKACLLLLSLPGRSRSKSMIMLKSLKKNHSFHHLLVYSNLKSLKKTKKPKTLLKNLRLIINQLRSWKLEITKRKRKKR